MAAAERVFRRRKRKKKRVREFIWMGELYYPPPGGFPAIINKDCQAYEQSSDLCWHINRLAIKKLSLTFSSNLYYLPEIFPMQFLRTCEHARLNFVKSLDLLENIKNL